MGNTTPRQLAFYLAFSFAVIAASSIAMISFFTQGAVLWQEALFCALTIFGLGFFLIKVAIDRFIFKRIKLIYKSIHRLKAVKTQKERAIENDADPIGTVSKEVFEWAGDQNREIESLKEQMNFRREFIGNLAHELKTPIFNMQGYLYTLLEGGLEDASINVDYLEKTDKNLERLTDLVADLDSITKLESGGEEIEKKPINIVDLTADVMSGLEHKATNKDIRFFFKENYERPIWVNADKGKIAQVLTNLLANSINYGVTGGETEVRFYDMDVNILVEIADNGIGINEEEIPRLFERFYRVEKSRSRHIGGSGLGLAIVKHIIEAHKQNINIRSMMNEGSTFSFTLEKVK